MPIDVDMGERAFGLEAKVADLERQLAQSRADHQTTAKLLSDAIETMCLKTERVKDLEGQLQQVPGMEGKA